MECLKSLGDLQGVYIDLGKTDLASDKIGGIRLAYLNKFCIIK